MSMSDSISSRLEETFAPHRLEVEDQSEMHRGHAGYQEGGESHWHVVIESKAFAGQSRIARHRAVHAALGPDIMGKIHALSLDISE
ncbi:BolA family protein [Roseicyclus sp. F158]|uniref:BolA family protein n=1 Tax=Tropicimonas omnivorans TaxID=3075590 RepID=A0ABU3DJ06_9RHOB|nr:BolA family protein [Roseicyclus sp. F158]MDT0683704.1 BolA family protein [Roseicyclus sp. F158]